MLKYIIYILTPYGRRLILQKNRGEKLPKNRQILQPDELEGCLSGESTKEDGILYICDFPAGCRTLKEKGFAAAVWQHDQNATEDLGGIDYILEDADELTEQDAEEIYRRLKGIPWDILETEHLLLRETTLEDVPEFYRIYRGSSITKYMEDLYEDPEEELAYTKDYIQNMYGFYGYGIWTVLLKSEKRVIGRAGLNLREGYESPEIGFLIEEAYQRRGYAYEACKGILHYARERLMVKEVQALVEEANVPSVRLLKKLGFKEVGKVTENHREYLWMKADVFDKQ